MREVLIIAGEASGDLHASGFASALKQIRPDLALTGVGGARMENAGVTLLERSDGMAVMGFVEVIRQVPQHYALLSSLKRRLRSGSVALLVVIDYPGFNMKLASAAAAAGVPVLYYITPQVWAWGAGRLKDLARIVTRAAPILPFEESLLRAHGINATFVGHPLLDRIAEMPDRDAARRTLGLKDDDKVLALFPGSRAQEIDRHLDPFVETARMLETRHPGLRVLVSAAPTVTIDPERCPYPRVPSASFSVLRAADAALCKSGTTTLEAAVAGCPLAVAYKTSTWTYAIARRVVKIPNIGLVNVVAGKEVAREFVQDAVVPERVADALDPLLDHTDSRRIAMLEDLAQVRTKLGTPGASARVAQIASELAA
ncbi:MAG TPA: lipid-A-disaccharide synthase [Gemmatimonadaceae bacterium]|nr:lipid-A-disaccharide synthase [Gemmatimonadaceae bacterium]